jgi:hypothetical protein
MLGWNKVRKLAPAGVLTVAASIFMGCVAEVEVRRGNYYADRIWHSDPYCSYGGYSYGCRYYGDDAFRIRLVERRRWNRGWNRGWRFEQPEQSAVAAAKTWESEFGLSPRSATFLRTSFRNALKGNTQQLYAMGISYADIRKMSRFELPSATSIRDAAETLGTKPQDLKDFLEVFMIRMKAAYSANERFE